jgi:hypothetical protein
MTELNFREFLEADVSGPTYTTQDGRRDYIGNTHDAPDTMLDFPTVTTTGTVIRTTLVGKNYAIHLEGETTIFIECDKFHRRYGKRLPQRGDIIEATWYKYHEGKNYTLKGMKLSRAAG